jgi:hypothetical protein
MVARQQFRQRNLQEGRQEEQLAGRYRTAANLDGSDC